MTIYNKEINQALHKADIMFRLLEHRNEAFKRFPSSNVVGVFLQGSQNYNLDLPDSDVDTKCIVVPSFKDICLNRKPVSTTHIRENEEHTDDKDIRLYMETFRKQNLNFLEILFTSFLWVNPEYEDQWDRLIADREKIARMNPWRAVKSMKGIALEKYHAMEHKYPSKVAILARHGYDPKQLHHLVRVKEYLVRYISGESYADCLIPSEESREYLLDIKRGLFNLSDARAIAEMTIADVEYIANQFCDSHEDAEDAAMRELLEDVSYNIMKIAVEKELSK